MKTSINHHSNDKISFQQQQQQPKFIVLDEENDYTNTPKKITTSTPKKDDFEFEHQQQPEILFPKVDLFSCDQYPPLPSSLSSDMINDKRINNGGHDDLIGQIFSLADTQKNSMLSMIMMTGDNNFQNDNNDKSSSCDKLDIIQSPSDNRLSIDKHHHRSENDLTMKNDLTRLAHLKEEQQPQQSDNYYYDGMIDRFRKKFSLRSQQSRISLSADNSPKHKINNMNYKIDINQNKIDFVNGGGGIEKQSKKQLERYTPSPEIQQRRQFMSINRKSLRKISKKHGRLKRSQTQPLNDDNDNVEKKNLLMNKDSEINNNKCLFGMNGEITIDNDDDNYKRNIIYAEAIFDYQGNDNEELSFNAGDLIEVSDISHKQWWWGTIKAITNKSISTSTKSKSTSTTTSQPSISKTMTTTCDEIRHGWIPASYVRLKVSQEDTIEESLQNVTDHHHRSLLIDNQQQQPNDNNIVDNNNDQNDMSPSSQISNTTTPLTTSTTTKLMSSEQVRSNIILEIWNTEKDFVKNLKDVIDGYLKPCRDRKDMFDELRIQTIFGNIEELYEFQSKFLEQLDKCIDRKNLAASCIGHCFLSNEKGFDCYSDFCKNHPLATSELQDLYTDHKYVIFFEGCRLLQNMIDISLDGFLLTPIQKICKYPLQLAELLKYTRIEHLDYQSIAEAYKCMQRVAQLVNERKSRFESLEKLLSIQELFENWDGPSLLDTSSLLIHSGEITRIIRTTWSKELTVFIFDHLLIMARKDSRLLKKRTYLFKTRIELDYIDTVISLDDNVKDNHFNIMVKNAFKFYYHPKQKWYLFQAKSLEDKEIWLRAFEQERQRCRDDQQQCFIVTEQDKKSAKLAHQNQLKQKQKPKYFGNNIRKPTLYTTKISTRKPDTVIAEIPLGPMKGFEIDRYNRAGSLPSYIYHQEKHRIHNNNNNNLFINNNHHHPHSNKNRQSTMNKKSNRTNWFQFGNNNHNNNGGGGDDNTTKQMLK
uniref:Uncharacterized protein LOC113797633 n=1 Tax=Dermatophagoides pteronyssinus TaxID=6956 RepID=A0A6P6YG56_DERPT|nr:uncharacterized protein LOC113797633 [Dermatophagoides pteronyssinus]